LGERGTLTAEQRDALTDARAQLVKIKSAAQQDRAAQPSG
jgi:hypothetical protein